MLIVPIDPSNYFRLHDLYLAHLIAFIVGVALTMLFPGIVISLRNKRSNTALHEEIERLKREPKLAERFWVENDCTPEPEDE